MVKLITGIVILIIAITENCGILAPDVQTISEATLVIRDMVATLTGLALFVAGLDDTLKV